MVMKMIFPRVRLVYCIQDVLAPVVSTNVGLRLHNLFVFISILGSDRLRFESCHCRLPATCQFILCPTTYQCSNVLLQFKCDQNHIPVHEGSFRSA